MKFFYGCTDDKEAKEIYRKLAKCFHPDKGGSSELMVELQKQYDNWDKPVVGEQSNNFTPNNFGRYRSPLGEMWERQFRPNNDPPQTADYINLKFERDALNRQVNLLIQEKLDAEKRIASHIREKESLRSDNDRLYKTNVDLVAKNTETNKCFLSVNEHNARLQGDLDRYKAEIARLTKLKVPKGMFQTLMNKIGVET